MPAPEHADSLNEAQKRHLLASYQYADKLLSEVESILSAANSRSPFPRYRPDLSPVQVKIIEDYVARLRAQMVRTLSGLGIEPPEAQFGSLHAIRVTLGFADIAFEECRPKRMRGYGEVPEALLAEMNGAVDELQSLLARLNAFLTEGVRQDLAARLESLERTVADLDTLKSLERIIRERGLVEFRPALAAIVERLESGAFEIAVFGRVSSGKSSLLNHILQEPVLPVGVTPVTAVPTRILYGAVSRGRVWFADAAPEQFPIERLVEFVSEQSNPGNQKHVTRVEIELPAPRLRQGVVFVDTPGFGSLAEAGARETRAYLPQCDLGVLLVDAASTLTQEDLATLGALYEAGVPAQVLLSKADLLAPPEQERLRSYVSEMIRSTLGWRLPVHAVSVKAGYEAAAEGWFQSEILPLYDRRRELSQRSLKRKIAVLQAGVQAALQTRLRRLTGGAPAEATLLREIETALRTASGWFSEAQQRCFRITDRLRQDANSALLRAARALMRRSGRAAELLDRAFREVAVEAADDLAAILTDLAEQATGVLHRAASAFQLPENAPGEDELRSLLREMPRWQASEWSAEVKPNQWLLKLSPALEERRLVRRLRRQIGPRVAEAFAGYGRSLESWARQTLLDLQSHFETYAEAYRAQMERPTAQGAGSPDELAALRRDLEELGNMGARTPI